MSYTEHDHAFNAFSVRFEAATAPRLDPDHETRPTVCLADTAYVSIYRDTDDDGNGRLRISVDIDRAAFESFDIDTADTDGGLVGLPIRLDLPGGTVWEIDGEGHDIYHGMTEGAA